MPFHLKSGHVYMCVWLFVCTIANLASSPACRHGRTYCRYCSKTKLKTGNLETVIVVVTVLAIVIL